MKAENIAIIGLGAMALYKLSPQVKQAASSLIPGGSTTTTILERLMPSVSPGGGSTPFDLGGLAGLLGGQRQEQPDNAKAITDRFQAFLDELRNSGRGPGSSETSALSEEVQRIIDNLRGGRTENDGKPTPTPHPEPEVLTPGRMFNWLENRDPRIQDAFAGLLVAGGAAGLGAGVLGGYAVTKALPLVIQGGGQVLKFTGPVTQGTAQAFKSGAGFFSRLFNWGGKFLKTAKGPGGGMPLLAPFMDPTMIDPRSPNFIFNFERRGGGLSNPRQDPFLSQFFGGGESSEKGAPIDISAWIAYDAARGGQSEQSGTTPTEEPAPGENESSAPGGIPDWAAGSEELWI